MRSIIKISVLVFAGVALFLTGCKPKDSTPTAMLMLHLHTNIDTNEVAPGTSYPNWNHKNIQLTRAQYYISGIKLTKTDNSIVPVSGTVLIVWPTEDYIVGNVPVGSYKSISFNVGVQPSDNHSDPSTHTGADALAAQTPSMHFAANADGYIFMAVEGLIDSSAAGTGTPNKAFRYHLGTDALLRTVTLGDHSAAPYNYTYVANANGSVTVHMIADFDKLFNGIDMSTNNMSVTTDWPWLAAVLADSIPHMFRYEE